MRKYTELLTIPAAIVLLLIYNWLAESFGLHTITINQVGKVFVAFVIYLIAIGFVRITHLAIFPRLYKYFDPSFEYNNKWKLLSEKERFRYSFYLHVALLLLFGLIVNGL
ncbi:hypothetical protein OU798_07300 [Prolixibacteraceae bacterium Z1-6]|uniref:Uncharacterized protein n=1 Tax=Draconibacterium aestuarii TaxID=2998507 RepID=A0A9X3F5H8_9BACT|nr:hypothetical protein [Prolixibacteraceae bacterium Z1-6]